MLGRRFGRRRDLRPALEDGSRVGIVGGGPAGSFFSYFLLQMAERVGLDLRVDIYEPRDFSLPGPKGCNMCGGIISESLVQCLAAEGIELPPTVVQRSIDSYFMHMDVGSGLLETPLRERRIAAVHRGGGPRGMQDRKFGGFDGHLLGLAVSQGAHLLRERVVQIGWADGRPRVKAQGGGEEAYDLVGVAVGVNTPMLKLLGGMPIGYHPPRSTKAYVCELCLGRAAIKRYLGNSMHVFLLNIPRLAFGAIIPKGEFATLCLLGTDIDQSLAQAFLGAREVQESLPPDWQPPADFCQCHPWMNIGSAAEPFADRIVFIGDCGTTRLYKDGIGAAYRTAKAAALTAIFEGVSAECFRRHYWPACRAISFDNKLGKLIFGVVREIQKWRPARRAVWRMVLGEQHKAGSERRMSLILWDLFTGSASYRQILLRALHPAFVGHFLWNLSLAVRPSSMAARLGRIQ